MIETGARQDPASTTLSSLGRVLGVSVDWLLAGIGEPPTAESVRAAISLIAPTLVEEAEAAPSSERNPIPGKGHVA